MTLETFLKELRKTTYKNSKLIGNWYAKNIYGHRQTLRCRPEYSKEFCPITAVCYNQTGIFYEPYSYKSAADRIGLSIRMADNIANAADDIGMTRYIKGLRTRLLKAAKASE